MATRPRKKILFAAPECLPFAATGGLGEVIGSLPPQLARYPSYDVRVMMPFHSAVGEQYRKKMTCVSTFTVDLAWRKQECSVYMLKQNRVTYYFLDNEYYFNRSQLYGEYDDAERYAYFCRAVVETMKNLDFIPDILHCHDWQTALLPIYLRHKHSFPDTKVVFTIHNIEYQGIYDLGIMGDVLDLPQEAENDVTFNNCVNLMKGAILCAHAVSTVSPSYAKELCDPYYAHGLAGIISEHSYKLCGILNGIDVVGYDGATDDVIAANFTPQDLEGKKACKAALQELAGLEKRDDVAVIALITRLVTHKGLDLAVEIADELMNDAVQLVVLGKGDAQYEQFFQDLAARYPGKASALIMYDKALSRKIYAGSDMFLMPSKSEPCGLSQMIASRYATVPIVRKTGGLGDSIADCRGGEGNGYVFNEYNAQEMLTAIRDAEALYYDKKDDWNALASYVMTVDFSWGRSAKDYVKLYKSLMG